MSQHVIFLNQSILAGQTYGPSEWIPLYDSNTSHAINGYFTGGGILRIYGKLAAKKSVIWEAKDDIDFIIDVASSDCPFHESIGFFANDFIRFYAQEMVGVSGITGFYCNFIQKGRGA